MINTTENIICPYCGDVLLPRQLTYSQIKDIVEDFMCKEVCKNCNQKYQIEIFFNCPKVQ